MCFLSLFKFWPHYSEDKSNFHETGNFLTCTSTSKNTINRSDMQLSSACSPFHSEQNGVLLLFLDRIYVSFSTPEANIVSLTGIMLEGKLGQWPWFTSDNVKRQYTQVCVKNEPCIQSQGLKKRKAINLVDPVNLICERLSKGSLVYRLHKISERSTRPFGGQVGNGLQKPFWTAQNVDSRSFYHCHRMKGSP